MKVVVTGGSGALGQEVIRELVAHGHHALCLDRKPHPGGHRPSWTADLTNPGPLHEACAGASAIIHLAAHIAPGHAPDSATFNDNVSMTYNALWAAAACRVPRAIIASSVAAYGYRYGLPDRSPAYFPVDEEHPRRPTDPYGLSKLVGEAIADSFALAHGMSIVSLRLPGINYDPSFQRIKALMKDPGARRSGFWSYVDVRDAATAFRLSLEAGLAGHRAFNLGAPSSNMREPTRDLVRRYFPEVKELRRDDASNWSGLDSTRAEKELGFRARHTWETAGI